MERFFVDRWCWLIFRLMESMFVEQGTINLGVLAAELDDDSGLLDFLGGTGYFNFIAQYDFLAQGYQEWLKNRMSGLNVPPDVA
jgi:hypothetical protein